VNAKEYLSQAYRIDRRVNGKLEQASSLRELTTKATSILCGTKAGKSNLEEKNMMAFQSSMCSTQDGWGDLSEAIILNAVDDYRHAISRLMRQPDETRLLKQKKELELFFLSTWFQVLTTLDGEQLLHSLQREAQRMEERA